MTTKSLMLKSVTLAFIFMLGLAACDSNDSLADKIEEVGDDIADTTDDMFDEVEDKSEDIADTTEDAIDDLEDKVE
jgi:uncharacterized protein YgfB (UPF0149 family)